MSIYREEAMDTLISCLRNTKVPTAQIAAAETIMSLQGRFTTSGKPLARTVLLKRAGLDKIYKQRVRMDQLSNFSGEDETLVSSFEKFEAHYLVLKDYFFLLCLILCTWFNSCDSFPDKFSFLDDVKRRKRRRLISGKEKWHLF